MVNMAPPMARPITLPTLIVKPMAVSTKKRSQIAKPTTIIIKQAKKF